jgi:hypothetical protein
LHFWPWFLIQFDWLIDWLIDCLTDWLTDLLIDWLIDWLREVLARTDYEAQVSTFCNFSALDNVSGKRSIEENWKKNSLKRTYNVGHIYKCTTQVCMWNAFEYKDNKLLSWGKNLKTRHSK